MIHNLSPGTRVKADVVSGKVVEGVVERIYEVKGKTVVQIRCGDAPISVTFAVPIEKVEKL